MVSLGVTAAWVNRENKENKVKIKTRTRRVKEGEVEILLKIIYHSEWLKVINNNNKKKEWYRKVCQDSPCCIELGALIGRVIIRGVPIPLSLMRFFSCIASLRLKNGPTQTRNSGVVF